MGKLPVKVVKRSAIDSWMQRLLRYETQHDAALKFVEALVKGEWTDDQQCHRDDKLMNALYRLQTRLQEVARDEGHRAWASEGLTKFMDILRRQRGNTADLADEVMRLIVQYLGVNHGALYLVEGEGDDAALVMRACYAYNRKKHIEHRINFGDGLVGQVALEKESLYLTDIPHNYIKITSGLGEALPSNLAVVPLLNDQRVVGVVEVASFRPLARHQIAFLEKVGESIASALVARYAADKLQHLVDTMQQQAAQLQEQEAVMREQFEQVASSEEAMRRAKVEAERLLAESQQQAQRLLVQEQELRQNLEELDAQSDQIQQQVHASERMRTALAIREEVFGHTTILSETDLHGTITHVNDKFCQVSGYTREELVGAPHNKVRHPDMPKEVFRLLWATIKSGHVFKGIVKNRCKDGSHYWVDATIVPIKDENGAIVKYIGARYHIQSEALARQLFEEQISNFRFQISD